MTRTGVSTPTGETKEGGHMTDCACPLCVPETISNDNIDWGVIAPPKPSWEELQAQHIAKALKFQHEAEQHWLDNREVGNACTQCGDVFQKMIYGGGVYCGCYTCYGDNANHVEGYKVHPDGWCNQCQGCESHCNCFSCDNCGKVSDDEHPNCCDVNDAVVCKTCCSESGCDECGASSGEFHGVSTQPGWTIRGVTVSLKAKSNDWRQYWTIPHDEIDLASEMCDFYIREFISSNMGLHGIDRALIPDSISWSVEEAQTQLDHQIAKLDPVFQAYIDMAVGGELRYHRAMAELGLGKGTFNRDQAWANWFHIREQVGPEALLDAAKLARELGEKTSILGVNWAVPAEILHARITNKIDPKTFIDRAFSLQHNGGALFNKLNWRRDNNVSWGMEAIKGVIGPAHFANPVRWSVLLAAASNPAVALFQRYWLACNKVRARVGLEVLALPSWKDDLVMEGDYAYPHYVVFDEKSQITNRWLVTISDKNDGLDLFFTDADISKHIVFETEYASLIKKAKKLPKVVSLDHHDVTTCKSCGNYQIFKSELYQAKFTVNAKIEQLKLPVSGVLGNKIRLRITVAHKTWWSELWNCSTTESMGGPKFIFGSNCDGKTKKPEPEADKPEYKVDYVPTQSLHASGIGVNVMSKDELKKAYALSSPAITTISGLAKFIETT